MESSDINENNCVICSCDFSTSSEKETVVTKGIPNLIEYCRKRRNKLLQDHLERQNNQNPVGKVLVHAKCRREFVDPKRAKRSSDVAPQTTPKKSKLRSNQPTFQCKTHCFYCDEKVYLDEKNKNRYPESRRVGGKEESVNLIHKVRMRCRERNDDFASNVRKRLSITTDLVADDAVYHAQCHAKFFFDEPSEAGNRSRGRPECPELQAAFNRVCDWLENEIDFFTLEDFHLKMKEVSKGDVYGVKRIKQKLEEKYKENIFFAEVSGRKNVVCFRNMADRIITDQWYANKKKDSKDEAQRIIETAAKIIKNELKEFLQSNSTGSDTYYPPIDEVKIGWIPDHLRSFFSFFIRSELKVETIGQCLMKAAMPRSVMPPMLFALAVESDHIFASRWLNTQLFNLGFAETYNEVLRFKQGVVMADDIDNILLSRTSEDSFVTFVADNIDHNIATLDGKGTFHGMGVIAAITNKGHFNTRQPRRLRPKCYTKVKELVRKKGITITHYDFPSQRGLDNILFKPYVSIMSAFTNRESSAMDCLWHSAGIFSTSADPRPNWNGFMQDVTKGNHPPQSDIVMLPIIDLNPNDETCIYSTLLFVIEQSKKLNVTTPSITFDQPLWLKALEIVKAKRLDIVPLLGGFHMLMSFYGSIGTIMAGSGIDKLFENIYGVNAVKHMLSGKAVARANRAHILTESALLIKLQQIALSEVPSDVNYVNLEAIEVLYKAVLSNEEDADLEIPEMQVLRATLDATKISLLKKSRTAKLWLQYIQYVETCRNFIRASRTGDWKLHLHAISKMINLYAATGHINYAKSARIYLQLMLDLENTHPWLHQKFSEEGLFVVRRSDRFWAGLWPDLAIEQVMMRSLKSRGGLTRGSGFTENVRILWIYSMHATATYHDALSSLTKNKNATSDQHQDLGKSRLQRDYNDLQKLISWLDHPSHNPFDANRTQLQALDSGLIADESVTCDDAENVGRIIQQSLDNVKLSEASIKRSQQAITLVSLKPSIKVGNQKISIDPMVLFSRLIVLMQRSKDISSYFAYELTPVPTSLFKDNMMRKPNKSALSKELDLVCKKKEDKTNISNIESADQSSDRDDVDNSSTDCDDSDDDNVDNINDSVNEKSMQRYVIDGGYLLHRVVWDQKLTYREVIQKYVYYVQSRYGKCSIVFDGYQSGPSTKDHEHTRRTMKSKKSPDVSVDLDNTIADISQQAFLSNSKNKNCFIKLLISALSSNGHNVVQCHGDADTSIVSAVLDFACAGENVCLIAADTDLLVMLVYMWNDMMGEIKMKNEGTRKYKESVRDVGHIARSLGGIQKYMTLVHAFGGCDTTSAIFAQGKLSILRLISSKTKTRSLAARAAADVFCDQNATHDQIGAAGLKLFVLLYGGKDSDSLSSLRYAKYMQMASSTGSIKPEKLPPTERAAYFHSLRVYHQVQEWNRLCEDSSNATNWGWKLQDGILMPVMTDKAPAPDDILDIIRCNCQLTSKHPCAGNRCSCRNNGLQCVTACGDCRGTECENCEKCEVSIDDSDQVENFDADEYDNVFDNLFF